MIIQYPHTIKITVLAGSVQNASGHWVTGTPTETTINCRFEQNSSNAFIKGSDGEEIYYNGTVYMPKGTATIAPGTIAEIKNGAEVLSNSGVLRFSSGQLNARAWV